VSSLTATGALARFVLRRDRLRLVLWMAGIVALIVVSGASLLGMYPDQAAIDGYVQLAGDNPALIAFAGPGYGFDDPTIGAILVNETQLWGCIGTALMSIFLVTRGTRTEEDSERADLVRSGVVGRHSPVVATIAVVAGALLAIGVVCAVAFIALGYALTGSIALAASMVAVGWVFAGITALAAQVASSARATIGLASTVLGVAFVLRAAGDIGDNWLSWTSPIGWAQAVRAFAGERWWTLLLCLAATVGLVVVTFLLAVRRDLGSGLISERPGPAGARPGLSKPFGLALRLQRGPIVGWAIGLFVTGVVFGSLGNDIDEMIEDNPSFEDVFIQFGDASLTDAFFGTAMAMLAVVAGGFAVSSALTSRAEESAGRAESILAAPVGRMRWAGASAVVAIGGTVTTIAAAGTGVGVAYAVITGDSGQVLRMLGAALVTIPAVLVLVGVTTAVFGWAPRFAPAAWAALAVIAVITLFGDVLRLPQWIRWLSPLEHTPRAPAETVQLVPLATLTAVAAALGAAGLWGLQRRDLQLH
jgi:ABC-2 type transport system permease protein